MTTPPVAGAALDEIAEPALSSDATPYSNYKATRLIAGLDGLRAISIIAVIGGHSEPWGNAKAMPLFEYGFYGVSLFFVISGYLITTLLLREHETQGRINLKNFYLRRSLRIFPLYYATLLAYCIIVHYVDHSPRKYAFYANLPFFVTYTTNWFVPRGGHFSFAWSLATEEQFYLVWAPLMALCRRFTVLVWLAGGTAIAFVMDNIVNDPDYVYSPTQYGFMTTIPPTICLGCLVAFLLHGKNSFKVLWAVLGRRGTGLAVAVALVVAFMQHPVNANIINVLLAVLVASVVIRPDGYLTSALMFPPLRHIGVVSYGMYLLHGMVLTAVGRVMPQGSALFVLTVVALTTVVATASYWGFEQRFLRLKARFEPRPLPVVDNQAVVS